MMVANSFDLWRKDSFFSAAEEVQESADVMESTYRMWIKEKRNGVNPTYLDQLSRDLQTAVGTAKWQLEEFERAVKVSHGHRADDTSSSRHKQFVAAIESQISRVDSALREALIEEGKKPLRWVDLDKEECDDLALFLSGTTQTPQEETDNCSVLVLSTRTFPADHHYKKKEEAVEKKGFGNAVPSVKSAEFVIEVEESEIPTVREDIIYQADRMTGTRRNWTTDAPNIGVLRIVPSDGEDDQRKLICTTNATPKEKGLKRLFWPQRCGEHLHPKGSSFSNQVFGKLSGIQRHLHTPIHLRLNRPVQLILALMLSIFLIVPFLVYST